MKRRRKAALSGESHIAPPPAPKTSRQGYPPARRGSVDNVHAQQGGWEASRSLVSGADKASALVAGVGNWGCKSANSQQEGTTETTDAMGPLVRCSRGRALQFEFTQQ